MEVFGNQEKSCHSIDREDGMIFGDEYHSIIDANNATAIVVKKWIREIREDTSSKRMEGYLRKRFCTSHYMGSYRFCVLAGTKIKWFLKREDANTQTNLRGHVSIQAIESWSGIGSMHTYPHAFAIRTLQNRLLLCSAESAEEKLQWIDAIENVLQIAKLGAGISGPFRGDRRMESEDAIGCSTCIDGSIRRQSPIESSSSVNSIASLASSSSCRYCGICLKKFLVWKVTCGCCGNDFCSKHCGRSMRLPSTLGFCEESESSCCSRCCVVCVERLVFREYLESILCIMNAILRKDNGMRLLLDVSSCREIHNASQCKVDALLIHRLEQSPMSLIHTIQLMYRTRTTPHLFRIACERLPFYAENAIDQLENVWYQILHLLECIDVRTDAEAYFVQLFYLKRYIRGICRRAPRIALQTIWHAQASLTYSAHSHSHTFLDLLGFIFPPRVDVHNVTFAQVFGKDSQANDSLWSSILLSDCPENLRSTICGLLHRAFEKSEALIHCETDSWAERWLNATSTVDFQRCAFEVKRMGRTLCEYDSSINYELFLGSDMERGRLQTDMAVRLENVVLKQVAFVQSLATISDKLRFIYPVTHRKSVLRKELERLNSSLDGMELYPLCSASDQLYKVVRIPPDDGTVFTTKNRAPTMIFMEAVPIDLPEQESEYDDEPLRPFFRSSRHSSVLTDHDLEERILVDEESDDAWDVISPHQNPKDSYASDYSKSTPCSLTPLFSSNSRLLDRESGAGIQSNRSSVRKSFSKSLPSCTHRNTSQITSGKPLLVLPDKQAGGNVSTMVYDSNVFGECWSEKQRRIRSASPMGHFPGWRLFSVIVKTNDDLRQEMFAMQIIDRLRHIFDREKLPLWLRPYRIIATGSDIGLLETITDACSLDHLKKRFGRRNRCSLWDYFHSSYNENQSDGSDALEAARTKFINSMAAYSLVSYVLQLKDRHNGNILLSSEGHIIHIDFGFILGIAPGRAFSLEDAPFKLTSEMVQVMGGLTSMGFQRFRTLLADGLIALQKHQREILTLLQLTGQNSTFACFRGSKSRCRQLEKIICDLKQRLRKFQSRYQLEQHVDALIRKSYNAWGTRQYDAYQYRSNNIDV